MVANFCYLLFVLIFISFGSVQCAGNKSSITTDAVISAEAAGKEKALEIHYIQNAGMWYNVPRLVEKYNMTNPSKLCVTGPWLLYSRPEFLANTVKYVQIFSGDNKCFKPVFDKKRNISSVSSMQPLSQFVVKENSFTLFEEPYYGSLGQTHAPKGSEVAHFFWSRLPILRSLVTKGKQAWTFFDYDGRAVCIKPQTSMNKPLCFLTDTMSQGLHKYRFATAAAGCGTSGYDKTVELKNCKEYGSGANPEPIPEDKMQKTLDGKVKPEIEKDVGDDSAYKKALERYCRPKSYALDLQPLQEDMIIKFALLRYFHDFSNPTQMLWPERQEDIWKTEILDTIYEIALMSIPEIIVPAIYLQTVREFTMYHLDSVWKKAKENLTLTDKQIDKVQDDLMVCSRMVWEHHGKIGMGLLRPFESIRNPSDLELGLRFEFQRNRKLDHVIETTYIVANYVYSLCFHMLESSNNFWMDYVKVVQSLYFKPLGQIWENATINARSYSHIFGGLGIKSLHVRLAYAVTLTFEETELLTPFYRAFAVKPRP